MARKEKNNSIKGEYKKFRAVGGSGFHRRDSYVYITVTDVSYAGGESASQSFSINEAKEIIGLIEAAIKEANKKEKN